MKLKELYDMYSPSYYIMVFGKPLNKPTIPFTYLPKDKDLMECEVIDYDIENREYTEHGVDFRTMKATKPIKRKGNIYVYVK